VETKEPEVEEIRQYLGVSNDTVYKWIDRHGMPVHRSGRPWKFRRVSGRGEQGGRAEKK